MKFHKQVGDNRGLTLIELIVAVAISAIALGAIWQFVLVSTRSYENSKAEAELQQEVQQTMNQMQNLLIDTNRAVAYYYEDGANYTQMNSDYDTPKDVSKRLEVYNDDTVAHLEWDKEKHQVVYKETSVENAASDNDADWESAVLAEGVETLALDLSQVEEKQVLKVKMSFERGNKTYTATRNIAMRNAVIHTGKVDDIYQEEFTVVKPMVTITPVPGNLLYPRDNHPFEATITNSEETQLLWTIQGQKSEDTKINISTGELVIGALETAKELTVIATLESDRTVNGIYRFSVGDPKAPTITILDERGEGEKGLEIPAPIETEELVINALCGNEYKIPIRAEVNPEEYAHKWTFIPLIQGDTVDAEIFTERDSETGEIQEYLIVGENQVDDFWLQADVVSNEANNGSDLCYVNVIPPTAEISVMYQEEGSDSWAYTYNDLTLYGGTKLQISAAWIGVVATENQPFGYNTTVFDKHDLEWTITTYKDDAVVKEFKDTKAATQNVDALTQVPFYGVDCITITAVSKKYTNIPFPTLKITVKEPQLQLNAYIITDETGATNQGETATTIKKTKLDSSKETKVGLYQWLQFEPEYRGGRLDNLQWSIQFDDGKEIVLPTNQASKNSDEATIAPDGTAKWNTVTTTFNKEKRMFGKTVKVIVREKDAPGVYASFTFNVDTPTKCNLDPTAPDANVIERNYLQPNWNKGNNETYYKKYIANYGFQIPIETQIPIEKEREIKIADCQVEYKDGTTSTEAAEIIGYLMKTEIKGNNRMLCKPEILSGKINVEKIQSIIYDIDDKYTGEHIAFIKLNMTLSNYNAKITDGDWWNLTSRTIGYIAVNSIKTKDDLNNTNNKIITTDPIIYCNYYGWEFMAKQHEDIDYTKLTPVSYWSEYKYSSGIFGLGKGWYIYVYEVSANESETAIYTAKYN